MEKLRLLIVLSLLCLCHAADAQKVKIDQEAAAIIGENAAAAVLTENFRTQKIDSVKKHKEKVAEALATINVLKESYKKAHLDAQFFMLETKYYKSMVKHGLHILSIIPQFISKATTLSPQATVKAIKVGTEISEEVSSIIDIYNKVCLNKTNYVQMDLPTQSYMDDGNEPSQPGQPSQPSQPGSDTTGNDNNDTPSNPSNPTFPDINIITDGDIGDITPGGGHQTPDDDTGNNPNGNITPRTNPDDNSSSNGGIGFRKIPSARKIGEVPGQNVADSTYVGVGGGDDGLDPIGGQVDHIDIPEPEYAKGDGFNWLSRTERLDLAVNLETRLAVIDYKMDMFIKTAHLYKPTDIVMMLDYHTWSTYVGGRYAAEDIINRMSNFDFNF